jgi:hypothetical protein
MPWFVRLASAQWRKLFATMRDVHLLILVMAFLAAA